jgi:L-seryl-tRNA(Ser) seleniumtransferase
MSLENRARLPSVNWLIGHPEMSQFEHADAVYGARKALNEARSRGGVDSREHLLQRSVEIALDRSKPAIRRAINGTGVILNTNLGRSRLAREAVEASKRVASDHSTLEIDLESGERGDRQEKIVDLLCELTGAESALVVNNNAAALMLCIHTFALGKGVLLSRGQSVEIGGSFRMPDIVRGAGGILVDVGCTNKTRLQDYLAGSDNTTALLLRCHPSNFVIKGFVEEPSPQELSALAGEKGWIFVDDCGSGCLVRTENFGLPHEPTLSEALVADIVTASGDKLLGGPQSGLILGKKELIDLISRNPLSRAVRIDKITVAAMEATLRLYSLGQEDKIPTIRYLSRPNSEIYEMTEGLHRELLKVGVKNKIEQGVSEVGGGAMPGVEIPSWKLEIVTDGPDLFARKMREGCPPVFGYVKNSSFWLDMRCVEPEETAEVFEAVCRSYRDII